MILLWVIGALIVAVLLAVAALFVVGVLVALGAVAAVVLAVVWILDRLGWTHERSVQGD